MTKPATPYMSSWASDTIPPYADRKISVEAANAEDERAGHHELDEELRAERRQRDQDGEDDEERDVATTTTAAGGPPAVHSALPNKPYGRTASTTASSANVRMIE